MHGYVIDRRIFSPLAGSGTGRQMPCRRIRPCLLLTRVGVRSYLWLGDTELEDGSERISVFGFLT